MAARDDAARIFPHNGTVGDYQQDVFREVYLGGHRDGFAEGIRRAREGMHEEFEEPLTYRHPHTGATITSKRFRRYVTDWEEVS